jgi:hypothetical protein
LDLHLISKVSKVLLGDKGLKVQLDLRVLKELKVHKEPKVQSGFKETKELRALKVVL